MHMTAIFLCSVPVPNAQKTPLEITMSSITDAASVLSAWDVPMPALLVPDRKNVPPLIAMSLTRDVPAVDPGAPEKFAAPAPMPTFPEQLNVPPPITMRPTYDGPESPRLEPIPAAYAPPVAV
jgi:hypothetical protein